MPSKRFFITAAPFAILAVAGVSVAVAQSSSPFASNKRAQAWEQPARHAVQNQAPVQNQAIGQNQAWQAAPRQAVPPQTSPVQLAPTRPYSTPPSYSAQQANAPVATGARPSNQIRQSLQTRQAAPAQTPAYRSSSTTTPPKTYGGQSSPNQLAGPGYAYTYSPPASAQAQPRYTQAPDLGTPAPRGAPIPPQYGAPPAQPQSSSSPYAPRSGSSRPQAWETPPPSSQNQVPQYQPQNPTYQNQGYQSQGYQNPTHQSSTPPTGIPPQGVPSQGPPNGSPYSGGPYTPQPQAKRSWKDRLGLGNIETLLRGAFTAGAAVSFRDTPDNQLGPEDGTSEDFIGDAELELEVSAITQGGLEYGFVIGGRAQYDPYRRGFGGRLPDCPPTVAGCSGQAFGAVSGLRGHTSGFYATGEDIAEDFQGDLESAHLFLRSAYGDVTLGRDDGAAYLFSLGAPSLLAVGASNSPVDYTGLDSVKTINDASGYSEKITYTSPRLLGDQIGVGVQLGVSYALDADVCGVDYCNGRNITGVIQPEIEDVFEVGLALDRQFTNGLGVELTGTYARGSESSGLAGLDDLQSFGTGLEFTYNDWTLGGSFLQSNNGLLDGDYTAYDAGVTWKPGALGFTLGYGHAEDDNLGLTSDQGTFGVTYEFNKFTLGTGVQYVDREVNGLDAAGALTTLDQKAASVFVQGGFKF